MYLLKIPIKQYCANFKNKTIHWCSLHVCVFWTQNYFPVTILDTQRLPSYYSGHKETSQLLFWSQRDLPVTILDTKRLPSYYSGHKETSHLLFWTQRDFPVTILDTKRLPSHYSVHKETSQSLSHMDK